MHRFLLFNVNNNPFLRVSANKSLILKDNTEGWSPDVLIMSFFGCLFDLFSEPYNATIGVKVAAYGLFQDVEVPYPWVAAILRLIRPVLTILLVVIV